MRMTLTIVLAAAVAFAFVGVAAVKAQPAGQPAPKKAKEGKEVKGENPYKNLKDLTDKQKAEIKAVRKQAKADAEKATSREDKEKIHKAANEKIRTTVLTDAQRKQLEEQQGQHKEARHAKAGHEAKADKAASSAPMGTHRS